MCFWKVAGRFVKFFFRKSRYDVNVNDFYIREEGDIIIVNFVYSLDLIFGRDNFEIRDCLIFFLSL